MDEEYGTVEDKNSTLSKSQFLAIRHGLSTVNVLEKALGECAKDEEDPKSFLL